VFEAGGRDQQCGIVDDGGGHAVRLDRRGELRAVLRGVAALRADPDGGDLAAARCGANQQVDQPACRVLDG
jgi:hypothetical protein